MAKVEGSFHHVHTVALLTLRDSLYNSQSPKRSRIVRTVFAHKRESVTLASRLEQKQFDQDLLILRSFHSYKKLAQCTAAVFCWKVLFCSGRTLARRNRLCGRTILWQYGVLHCMAGKLFMSRAIPRLPGTLFLGPQGVWGPNYKVLGSLGYNN